MEMTMRRSGKRVVIVIRLDDGTTITIDIPP
jgi:ribosomal protein L14E/L6E/L27E